MKQSITNSQDFNGEYQHRFGSRQGLNNKENVCQNSTENRKTGLNKLSKFIKQKTNIMNSNNINVRKEFGSNDSTV
jgi:hypothetical protein